MSFPLAWTACNTSGKKDMASSPAADSVKVFYLKKEYMIKPISLPGELIPYERAELFARMPGYVKTMMVDIGDRARKDQVLAVLEAPEVVANYAKSQAELEASLAKYNASRDQYTRIKNAAQVKGIVSDIDLENARDQMQSDSAVYESARSAVRSFEQLKNYLVIRAPFDGIITGRTVDPGDLAGPGSKPLLVIEDSKTLRLRIAVPEIYSALKPDSDKINFQVNALPGKNFKAQFSRRSGTVDDKTRTEIWEFLYINTDGLLKSGMFADTNLRLKGETGFTVPYSALVTNQERNFVIRVNQSKAEWVEVTNGIRFNDKIEILGPLAEGDQLIMNANDEIRKGQVVIVSP